MFYIIAKVIKNFQCFIKYYASLINYCILCFAYWLI
uniref:Uncharacterized protein n=1 Tax=Arundo donax TaxID=35708 RepID=A0A0A9DX61_ARUDO